MCASESAHIVLCHGQDEIMQMLLIPVVRTHRPAGVHVSSLMRCCWWTEWKERNPALFCPFKPAPRNPKERKLYNYCRVHVVFLLGLNFRLLSATNPTRHCVPFLNPKISVHKCLNLLYAILLQEYGCNWVNEGLISDKRNVFVCACLLWKHI